VRNCNARSILRRDLPAQLGNCLGQTHPLEGSEQFAHANWRVLEVAPQFMQRD
jgi:hypothetical protein